MSNFATQRTSLEEQGSLLERRTVHQMGVEDNDRAGVYHEGERSLSFQETLMFLIKGIFRSFSLSDVRHFLTPSFLQGPQARAHIRPAQLHPTAWLDGMRGVAAFAVVIGHWATWIYSTQLGWGADGNNWDWWRLPLVRLPYQGSIQVAIFFVISGYVLSYKPIKLMRTHKFTELQQTMASMAFRRWARLFLPCLISTFIIAIMTWLGLFVPLQTFVQDEKVFPNRPAPIPQRQDGLIKQLCHWFMSQWYLSTSTRKRGIYYDWHLWTIPFEFRCSLYLFITMVATARLQVQYRLAIVFLVMLNTFLRSNWQFFLFLAGMLLAECDNIRGAHLSALARRSELSKRWASCWVFISCLALLLMGTPEQRCRTTPGWKTLCGMVPEDFMAGEAKRVYQCFGGILWIASVSRLPFWLWFYETNIAQYLGKISYSIYLVHMMTNYTVGLYSQLFIFKYLTGIEGNMRHVGFFLSTVIYLVFTVWCADVFWRLIDIPIVTFARWVERHVNIREI